MKSNLTLLFALTMGVVFYSCGEKKNKSTSDMPVQIETTASKINVIFDTDANNELDDQHAQAYLVFNKATYNVKGITVNATYNGGNVQNHYDEAQRVLELCDLKGAIPILKGADGSFEEISRNFDPNNFDGQEGIDFLLEETKKDSIVIVAVGKLTNIALALKKDPAFAQRTKIVWLGSNYPDPGEYNQDNDTIAMNYVLKSTIPFEMVTVRYGKPSGTDAVRVTQKEINFRMPGLGPKVKESIVGRHGGTFNNFGDYSVSLFEHIDYHGDPPSRSLFDMAAVAILKNGAWARKSTIPAPLFIDNTWVERPDNIRKITIWQDFNKEKILGDFFETLKNSEVLVNQ
ncbi:MAG: nucleoside hydrolase [Maribacter sp.]|uniref:nucleoside hydrolase n=1 Tax=Maribacter sp. TaxID=1897614 RepID=UPI003C774051